MRIRVLKDVADFTEGMELSFASWRNEKDRSISGKLTHDSEFIHFDVGTFRRLDVFRSSYTVDVSNLGLPHDLSDDLQCHLEASNDSHHDWNTEDEWFSRTSEVNQYLNDAGVPSNGQIILHFSW